MSNSPRRDRERAALREGIVAAALRVLETEGAASLTIRRIAAEVEYKAPVIYSYFASKDALLIELVSRGFDLMHADLLEAANDGDVDRRVFKAGTAYVRFARRHPHLYEIMNGTAVDAEARQHAAKPSIDMLAELLDTWSSANGVSLNDPNEACEIIWGTMSGMASLATIGSDHAQKLAEQALRAILVGWRAGDANHIIPQA